MEAEKELASKLTENTEVEIDGLAASSNVVITNTSLPANVTKSRGDEESVATTTSSEIEVISTCTSVYDDSSAFHPLK